MPIFRYKAKDTRGRLRVGTVRAANRKAAKERISGKRLRILYLGVSDVNSDSGEEEILGQIIYRDGQGNIQISLGNQNPSVKELIVFTKQFSTMLNSGVPMIQALGILSNQQHKRVFRNSLYKVQRTVENGGSLSQALAEFPSIFDNLYVALVEAGEASGKLDTILLKLVSYIEKSAKIKSQVKSAMMYPAIVVMVALVVVTGLLMFVVPTFAQQYQESGRELPGLTQAVIDFSNNFVEYWHIYFGSLLGSFVLLNYWIKTSAGRRLFDSFILRSPGLGVLMQKIAVGRFCSTMASMLTSGVNLLEALSICAASAGNKTIEEFILGVRFNLEKGSSFSDSLNSGNLIPEMVVSMVAVGESTGALDEMLTKVSEFYEEEVDIAVQTLLSMIEPVMIVLIGSLVGFIVIAMYLPVFEMASGIG